MQIQININKVIYLKSPKRANLMKREKNMKGKIVILLLFCLSPIISRAQNDSITTADSITWTKMLNEVTVKGHRHIVRVKGNALVAHIANTELSQLGTANDVLSRLPFVNMDGDEINIVGKGKPMIFIDNRPMHNDSELQMLKSENIKNIQIITSPGAEYSSEVKAVIKIQTKQSFFNGLSGKLTSQTTRKRVWEEMAIADLSYNWTNWQVFGQLMYNIGGSKNKVKSTTDFLYGDRQNHLRNTATQRNKLSETTVKGGFSWNEKGQSLGAYYQYTNTPTHMKNRGTEIDDVVGAATEPISKLIDTDAKSEKHFASVYYDNSFKNGSLLHFDGNYMHTRLSDYNLTQAIYTNSAYNEIVPSATDMRSNLWAGKLYFEFPFVTGKLNVGTESSYTLNCQQFTMLNDVVGTYIPSTENESRQQNYAAFATYTKDWDALSVQLGLRWEYVKFDYKHNNILDKEISRTDNCLSPNISLSYNFNENTFMALDYAHSITRPPYKQLRSSLLYVGPYEVEGGNPTLGDCETNTLGYLFGWRDLTLEATYYHQENTYVYTKEHYSADNRPILIFSPRQANISNLNVYISYAPVIKFWKPNLTFGFDKQWLTLYGGNYDKPVFRYMLKNMFTPSENWLITLDVTGSTRGHVMTNEMYPQWGVNLSVRRFFMQKRFQVVLSANDIFHTRDQSWLMKVKDINLYKDSDADTRKVMLTVSYSFNPKKSRYKGHVADEKEMKRL